MNRRDAIRAANAALHPQIKVVYDTHNEEWQVHYPLRRTRTLCPASDFADACGTACLTAQTLGLAMRGEMPQDACKLGGGPSA
jgi:hypothetical protein